MDDMDALSTADWLNVWEAGLARQPIEWALTLLAVARPDWPVDAVARLSIGQRNAQLLALREQLFGSQVNSVTTCPACGEELELRFDLADICASPHTSEATSYSLAVEEWLVEFRLPDSFDVISTAGHDVAAVRRTLFERCLVKASRDGSAVPSDQLPESAVSAVAARMAEIDPQAFVQITLVCPACDHSWEADFDIVRFLWAELNAWALRTFRDVHQLALAYSWPEADILNMNPWRRQVYLELIG